MDRNQPGGFARISSRGTTRYRLRPHFAQMGNKHASAKPLKGFGGAGVLEIIRHRHGSTYRVVYKVSFPEVLYVLHAFQKKSKKGVRTPAQDIDLVKKRLKRADEDYRARQKGRRTQP